jgi:hypothetical protein
MTRGDGARDGVSERRRVADVGVAHEHASHAGRARERVQGGGNLAEVRDAPSGGARFFRRRRAGAGEEGLQRRRGGRGRHARHEHGARPMRGVALEQGRHLRGLRTGADVR